MPITNFNQLRQRALKGDISWAADVLEKSAISASATRNYGNDPDEVKLVMHSVAGDFDAVRGLGHAIEAKNWLESTTDIKMQYGTATRAERYERAALHAAKAGVPLELIAETWDLYPQIETYDSWEGNVPMNVFLRAISKAK